MRVFAIGDLHLSLARPKPMDVFGPHWSDHWPRIRENWEKAGITGEDAVLIPGDISWAMAISEAAADLSSIGELPGKKLMIRGNHDYWWSSLSKVRSILPKNTFALQNDAMRFPGLVVCGTRGWSCPGTPGFSPEDQKLYLRELIRMELSLNEAKKLLQEGDRLIAMIHYPPFNEQRETSGFTDLFASFGVECVVYGHLHGRSCRSAFEGELNGVQYTLTSCDHLGFKPKLIMAI